MSSILYLDDEEPLAVLMKRMLERLGHRVTTFTSSEQALSAFTAAPAEFDLVMSDLSMPGMSGIEFAQCVRAMRPDALVVIVTGHVQDKDVERARAVGVHEVMQKPHNLADLSRAVTLLLEQNS